MRLFRVSDKRIESTFIYHCGLIIAQNISPHSSLVALDNSAFARTERDLGVVLTFIHRWELFQKLVEKMRFSVEKELLKINNDIVVEVGANCLIQLRSKTDVEYIISSITDMNAIISYIMPRSSIAKLVLSDFSLHRGKKMDKLNSQLDKLESIQGVESLRRWALDVAKLGKNE